MSGEGMISVAEALARVLASAPKPVGSESVTIEAALGRTLASDLRALRTQPPFANSAMDGYALRAADTAHVPARLRIIGESAAGRAFAGTVGAERGGPHFHRRADARGRRCRADPGECRARRRCSDRQDQRGAASAMCATPASTLSKTKSCCRRGAG